MLRKALTTAGMMMVMAASNASAADVLQHLSIQNAEKMEIMQQSLDGDIKFYWANQQHPPVDITYGTFTSSKRTNGFRKPHEESCARALASALIAFQDRARRSGGNAVIDIKSNIKNREEVSAVEYSCLVGTMMVNVALKGTVVKLAQ